MANFDEDSVTMAVAAARDCLSSGQLGQVRRLFLASTSLPYSEKQSAVTVATAVDLPKSTLTVDIAHSLRGATTALQLAADGPGPTLVVASDKRLGEIESAIERTAGDGAAALLVGEGEVIAKIVAASSINTEILDVWRPDGASALRVAHDRFRAENSFQGPLLAALEQLEQEHGLKASDVQHVALSAQNVRQHREALGRIGQPDAEPSPLLTNIGMAGTAQPLLELIAALDRAEPGERILLLAGGDGADAIVLEATDALKAWRSARRPLLEQAADCAPLPDYLDYLRWQGILPDAASQPRRGPRPTSVHREEDTLVRLHGGRCGGCGAVQYPTQRVCPECRARDQMEPVPLANLGATLFSYSFDRISPTHDIPHVHGVVDFDGGGRAVFQITDRDLDEIAVGLKLAPTFRKLDIAEDVHPYLWKMTPVR